MYPTLRFDIEDEYDPLRIGTGALGGASVVIEPTVSQGGRIEHAVWAFDDPDGGVGDALRTADTVVDTFQAGGREDSTLYRVRWEDEPGGIFVCVREADGTLLEAVARDGTWTFLVRLPSSRFERFQSTCERLGLRTDIRFVDSGLPQYRDGNSTSAWDRLTCTQAETLSAAFDAGYFEVPRRTSLSELSMQLGISDSATSQRLRRGLSNLLSETDTVEQAAPPVLSD